jgi:hypothetical protein
MARGDVSHNGGCESQWLQSSNRGEYRVEDVRGRDENN